MDGKEWRRKNRIDSWESEFVSCVIIHNQKELDKVPVDYTGHISIKFGTEEKRAVLDRELSAIILVFYDSVIEIRKPNRVRVWDSSIVYAWNKDDVKRFGNAKVCNLEED